MTTKKSSPNKDQASSRSASGPKKPYATLDLKATELKNEKATAKRTSGDSGAAKDAAASSSEKPSAKSVPASGSSSARDNAGKASGSSTASRSAKSGQSDKYGSTASNSKPKDTVAIKGKKSETKSGSGIGGFITHMAAGVVGGALALFGGDAIAPQLAQLGVPVPAGNSAQIADAKLQIDQRIAALEERVGASPAATNLDTLEAQVNAAEAKLAEVDALSESIGAVKAQVRGIEAELVTARDEAEARGDPTIVEERISGVEQQLATMEAAAGQDGSGIANLAAITGRLGDLETTLTNQMAALRNSVGNDIETRISTIAEASESAKSGTARMDRQLSTVVTDSTRLSQRLEVIKADMDRLSETVRVAMEETAGVKSVFESYRGDTTRTMAGLASLQDVETAVGDVTSKVDALRQNVSDVVEAEKDRKANAKRIVLSLELGNLKRAVERGDAYTGELSEVRAAAADELDLSTLDSYATTGVATIPTLQKAFRPVADAVLSAAEAPAEGSVFDQFVAGARSLVRVRKVNHSPDDTSLGAIVGRMEKAIESGELDRVVAAAKTLPVEAREPAEDWLANVEARRSVSVALREIEGQLKASLSGSTAPGADAPADNLEN